MYDRLRDLQKWTRKSRDLRLRKGKGHYHDSIPEEFLMCSHHIVTSPCSQRQGPISWFNLAASGVIVGIGLAFYYYARGLKEEALAKERKKTLGKAAIGGKFDLTDHTGKPAKSEDFYGKWILLYFGFTHCPDICPEEMEKMAEITDTLTAKASDLGSVQPIIITVDPRRDGVSEMAEYVKEFHPKLIGLTGSEEQIKSVCKAFRVYYSSGETIIIDQEIVWFGINFFGFRSC